MPNEKSRGFTLVELMVVIVIVGLLSGVVAIRVVDHLETARVTTARTEISVLEEAIEFHLMDHGRYPETLEGLTGGSAQNPRGYLKKGVLPLDPWDEDYLYDPADESGGRLVFSKGKDRVEDTPDDVTSEVRARRFRNEAAGR